MDSEEVRQVRADYERERQMYGLFGGKLKEWKSNDPAWQAYEKKRKEYNQKIAALREESQEEARAASGLTAEEYHRKQAAQKYKTTVLTSMQTSICNANNMMSDAQGRTVDEIAQQSVQEMEQEAGTLLKKRYAWAGKATESRLGNAAGQLLGLDMMDARRYFTSLGETAQKKVYEPIRKGFDKRVWLLASAQDAFDDIVRDTDISQWDGRPCSGTEVRAT